MPYRFEFLVIKRRVTLGSHFEKLLVCIFADTEPLHDTTCLSGHGRITLSLRNTAVGLHEKKPVLDGERSLMPLDFSRTAEEEASCVKSVAVEERHFFLNAAFHLLVHGGILANASREIDVHLGASGLAVFRYHVTAAVYDSVCNIGEDRRQTLGIDPFFGVIGMGVVAVEYKYIGHLEIRLTTDISGISGTYMVEAYSFL